MERSINNEAHEVLETAVPQMATSGWLLKES